MTRPRLARRFEPRFGVSQPMLDVECRYVAMEWDDYLLLSLDDLRQKLKERQAQLERAEEGLQALLAPLPDRQRLALRCMLARDFAHIGLLYETFLRSPRASEETGPSTPVPEELTEQEAPRAVLPFSEWLFTA